MSSVFFLGAGRKISLHFPASCGILLEREIKSPGVVQLIERVVWDHEAASLSLATRTSSEIPITATFPPCGENCAMMGISSLFAHKRFAGLRAEERGGEGPRQNRVHSPDRARRHDSEQEPCRLTLDRGESGYFFRDRNTLHVRAQLLGQGRGRRDRFLAVPALNRAG